MQRIIPSERVSWQGSFGIPHRTYKYPTWTRPYVHPTGGPGVDTGSWRRPPCGKGKSHQLDLANTEKELP